MHESTASKLGSDDGLGDPAGGVGGRSVDLGGIFAGEGSTTVRTPTTIGIDDDLAASSTGVTLRTTNDEAAWE